MYRIIKEDSLSKLEESVNNYIANGYKPVGPIAIKDDKLRVNNPETIAKEWKNVTYYIQPVWR